MVLVINNWNDYGYYTLFTLFYYSAENFRELIGDVKILDLSLSLKENKNRTTELKESFFKLPATQASLGQSIDYYVNLKKFIADEFEQTLNSLNDLAINQGLRDVFEKHDAFKVSLLRSSEAEKVLTEGRQILSFDKNSIKSKFDFTYSILMKGADEKHSVVFNFNKIDNSFRNIVLIGKNGTGKTQFLSNLSASLCDINLPGEFFPSRPLFSRVIAISFSLFDKFKIPKNAKSFSYKYIGFRQRDEILNDEAINNKLRNSFALISKEKRQLEWFKFVNEIIELKYFGIEIDFASATEEGFEKIISRRSELLSSGQNILIFVITELIANLRRDSIILFDEPETHLHPNAIANMTKVINSILKFYDSYAIIATHSPIVVQETPSKNVRLFDRIGNTPVIKSLPEESFGENISKITDYIFYRNQVKEVYKEFFDEKMKKHSIEEINDLFENKLSMNALLYLNAINKKNK